MNKVEKAVVSGIAGLSVMGIGLAGGVHPEISAAAIETCATDLGQPNLHEIPLTCFNGTQTVFDTKEEGHLAVSRSGEAPFPVTEQKYLLLSPDEYRHRAYELKMNKESQALLQKLASVAFGVGVSGIMYYEWAINTPEHRFRKAADQNPSI